MYHMSSQQVLGNEVIFFIPKSFSRVFLSWIDGKLAGQNDGEPDSVSVIELSRTSRTQIVK